MQQVLIFYPILIAAYSVFQSILGIILHGTHFPQQIKFSHDILHWRLLS